MYNLFIFLKSVVIPEPSASHVCNSIRCTFLPHVENCKHVLMPQNKGGFGFSSEQISLQFTVNTRTPYFSQVVWTFISVFDLSLSGYYLYFILYFTFPRTHIYCFRRAQRMLRRKVGLLISELTRAFERYPSGEQALVII